MDVNVIMMVSLLPRVNTLSENSFGDVMNQFPERDG